MADPFLNTLGDVLSAVDGFVSQSAKPTIEGTVKRQCVESALRDIVSRAEWKAMKKVYRVQLVAAQNTGTVTYLATAGAYPLQVTLSGATWPSNATDGELRIGQYSINSIINNIVSPTIAQLDSNMYPAQDFATATGYTLAFPKYPLPPEFAAGFVAADRNAWFIGEYIKWEDYLLLDKYRTYTGNVRLWTIGPDPKRYGCQALYVHPAPQIASEYDLGIKAWRRPMNLSGNDPWQRQGRIAVAANSTTVTGTTTAFDQRMVGSILRVSATAAIPTGTAGVNPFYFQQSVASVTDATHLTLSSASTYTLSSVGYTVSDPCDVPGSLYDAFISGCFAKAAKYCDPKQYDALARQYEAAVITARAADNPDRSSKMIGVSGGIVSRLRDNQVRPWITG